MGSPVADLRIDLLPRLNLLSDNLRSLFSLNTADSLKNIIFFTNQTGNLFSDVFSFIQV